MRIIGMLHRSDYEFAGVHQDGELQGYAHMRIAYGWFQDMIERSDPNIAHQYSRPSKILQEGIVFMGTNTCRKDSYLIIELPGGGTELSKITPHGKRVILCQALYYLFKEFIEENDEFYTRHRISMLHAVMYSMYKILGNTEIPNTLSNNRISQVIHNFDELFPNDSYVYRPDSYITTGEKKVFETIYNVVVRAFIQNASSLTYELSTDIAECLYCEEDRFEASILDKIVLNNLVHVAY